MAPILPTRRTATAALVFSVTAAISRQEAVSADTNTSPTNLQAAPQDITVVKEWIIKAHQRKLAPMMDLLERDPELVHASYDWGAGDWESALQAAAHTGSRDMARFLLDRNARPDLFAAAMLGELAFIKAALGVSPRGIEVRGAHAIPLLSHAIAGGTEADPVLRFLLESGADVNADDRNGMTPLAVAVRTGRRESVRLLLAKGANPAARAKNGTTPLSLSLKQGNAEITADLRAAGASE
jgi:hypothetical protein